MPILSPIREEKAAEVDHYQSLLGRIRVTAKSAGVAVVDEPSEWIGRPVSIGEKVMAVAEEKDTEVDGLQKSMDKRFIVAPFAGRVVDISTEVQEGGWVASGEPLFAVRGDGVPAIDAFVGEGDLHRLSVGTEASFVSDSPDQELLHAGVIDIDRLAVQTLDERPALASIFGGPIPVRAKDKKLIPEQALYRVRLRVMGDVPVPAIELRGLAHIDAPAESLLARLWRSVAIVVLRESGF